MADNAASNSLNALNPELWESAMQVVRHKENVAVGLCNVKYGNFQPHDKWHKPYRSFPTAQDYTRGTDVSIPAQTVTDESGDIDQIKVAPFYIDLLDEILNPYDFAAKQASDCVRLLDNIIDQKLLAEYSNADDNVDNGDLGGTAGDYAALTTTNIDQFFTAAQRKLDDVSVPVGQRFAVVGSRTLELLRLYIAGKDTSFGDEVGMNGFIGRRFGFNVFYSNNIPWTGTLSMATNPTEGDTVVIKGITATFNATPSGAGSVDIGSDAATSVANLVALIMDTGTAGTTYIQISAKNRKKLIQGGVVATDATTSITFVAYGDMAVSETLTATADVWSVQRSHELFGAMGSTELRLAVSPKITFTNPEKKLGRYVLPFDVYGVKTFSDGTESLLDGRIDASTWA